MTRLGRMIHAVLVGVVIIVAAYYAWQWFRAFQFYLGPSEATLSETGFDWEAARTGRLPNTYAFAPTFPFWSDGAEKERYIHIPPGTKIDTSDPDRWNFPAGTRIWKVFEREGTLVETRMLFKYAPEPWAWDMSVYQPVPESGASRKLMLAKQNVSGTSHDIPAPSACVTCHSDGEQRRPLGVTAIQLPWSDDATLSIRGLAEMKLLSHPPQRPLEIPGDELDRLALGYLHSNCGSCHYEGSTHVTKKVPLRLNLTTNTPDRLEDTNVHRTAVNQPPHIPGLGTSVYLEPGAPEASFLWRRMSIRDNGGWQMPPLATEIPDEEGVALIERWILSLEADGALPPR